jgi:hypothetical protein
VTIATWVSRTFGGKKIFIVENTYAVAEMDVAEQAVVTNQVKDQIGERCQKLFQDFLEE